MVSPNSQVGPSKDNVSDKVDTSRSIPNPLAVDPKSEKNFRNILATKERKIPRNQADLSEEGSIFEVGEEVEEEGFLTDDEKKLLKGQPTKKSSVFDLSSKKQKITQREEGKQIADSAEAMESPSILFKRMSSKNNPQAYVHQEGDYPNANLHGLSQKDLAKKNRTPSQFNQAQSDLAYVNQQNAMTQQINLAVQADAKQSERIQNKNLQELINKLVEVINEVKKSGVTETIVTLKYPPILEGANLIINSYETAKNEYNIRFENLTQAGKEMLDMQQNQSGLKQALQDKNIVIHMIVTTTQIETPRILAQENRFGRDQDREGQQQQQQQREREQEETEE